MRSERVPVEAPDNRRLQRVPGQLRRELYQPFKCSNRIDEQTSGQPAKALVAMSKRLPRSRRVVSAAIHRIGCRADSAGLECVAESKNALFRCVLASHSTKEGQLFGSTTARPHFIDQHFSQRPRAAA